MSAQNLHSEVVGIHSLLPDTIDALYVLYDQHYDGANKDRFQTDLEEKEWVILLREREGGQVVGFSTQMVMDLTVAERPVRVLFSGDTIIHRAYWGTQELVRAWCRFVGHLKSKCADRAFYWFLVSKGHRTYLYLPLFFNSYFPSFRWPTPLFETELIRTLGTMRYGDEFNTRTGLVEHRSVHDRMKPGLDTSEERLRNPDVAFFVERNPGYRNGVELACVAEISTVNMRSMALRELQRGMQPAI